jgi:hypothetical protein
MFSATTKTSTEKKQKRVSLTQPEVILLDSKITKEWYISLGWDYDFYINNIKNFLTKEKIKFTIISDEQLENLSPSTNKILILPNTRGMSKKSVESVKKYVLSGGKLFATSQTSIGDEKYQKVVPNRFQLEDIFGAKWLRWAQDGFSFGYIKKSTETTIFNELPETIKLYRNTAMVITPLPESIVVGEWLNNDNKTPSLPKDQNAAIVVNKTVVYCGEDLFDPENLKDELVQKLVKNIINYLLNKK